MDHVRLEFLRQLLDDQRIVRALVDANPTANAQAFGNVRFARFGVHHDAFLPVADRGAKRVALVVALLRLTVVNLEHRHAHVESSQWERAGGAL